MVRPAKTAKWVPAFCQHMSKMIYFKYGTLWGQQHILIDDAVCLWHWQIGICSEKLRQRCALDWSKKMLFTDLIWSMVKCIWSDEATTTSCILRF